MSGKDNLMDSVRSRCKRLSELFEPSSFVAVLNYRALDCTQEQVSLYTKAVGLHGIMQDNRTYFHRGHMLIIYLLAKASTLRWEPWESGNCDLEDVLSRRTLLSETRWDFIREDARIISQLFSWLWGNNILSFSPADAVHIKALIDQALDSIDSSGFLESLHIEGEGSGEYLLVRDFLAMQSEISHLLTLASDAGSEIPNIQHLSERNDRLVQLHEWLYPLQSPYLATPCREVLADERMAFFRVRNALLVNEQWSALAEHYEENRHLFEGDVKSFARYFSCLGRIYGERLHDNAKAVEFFEDALNYDTGDLDSFRRVKFYLRESKQWSRLADLLANHWESHEDMQTRCEMLIECAEIQAQELGQHEVALGLFERAYIEGKGSSHFEGIYQIIHDAKSVPASLRLRACVALSGHITSINECDRYVALSNAIVMQDDSNDPALKTLVQVGLQSYLASGAKALGTLKEAIVQNPRFALYEGVIFRLLLKELRYQELLPSLDELALEDISAHDLAALWMMVGRALQKLGNADEAALTYFEKAVICENNNLDAIKACLNLSERLQRVDKQWVYTALLLEHPKHASHRATLDGQIEAFKLRVGDDDLALCGVYEQMLLYPVLHTQASEGLIQCLSRLSQSDEAFGVLQRVESKCLGTHGRDLVAQLYRSILEREISNELKRGVLERYLGFMLGQGERLDRDQYLLTHAELFAHAPSERLLTMLRPLAPSSSDYTHWANNVEDKLRQHSDDSTKIKAFGILAKLYANELNEHEKATLALLEALRLEPENAEAFKQCFDYYVQTDKPFEAVQLIRDYLHSAVPTQEQCAYNKRAVHFAITSLNDYHVVAEFLNPVLLAQPNESQNTLHAIVQQATDNTAASSEQVQAILEALEQNEESPERFAILRLERANLLSKEQNSDVLAQILDQKLFDACKSSPAMIAQAQGLCESLKAHETYPSLAELWKLQAPTQSSAEVQNPAPSPEPSKHQNDDSQQEQILNNIQNPEAVTEYCTSIEAYFKTVQDPKVALGFCNQCGEAFERIEAYTAAETYFKRAFALEQTDNGLLDFYKRRRQYKKALKIVQFKISKENNPDALRDLHLDAANMEEMLGNFSAAITRLQSLLNASSTDTPKHLMLNLHRSIAKLHTYAGEVQQAVDALKAAGLLADVKQKEEIDVDCSFLLRDLERYEEARKLFLSLRLRGLNNARMTLLGLSFDIDDAKYNEAQRKLDDAQKSPDFEPLQLPLLEQYLRLNQARGDSAQSIHQIANEILALDADNPNALKALNS